MRLMLSACAIALTGSLASLSAVEAREYPWCARYDWTTTNCGFVSFQQCLATISGIGGRCEQNPRYVAAPGKRKRAR
ncbi:MAG: DUF3551 domain-containing protein [Pseudorhodoplanes sp.]|uniref:DUF3551 domain-containing protein n=1 Tax=Pseudorhodoplanes sp. TaxID=1934341 RepID=UPI003D136A51